MRSLQNVVLRPVKALTRKSLWPYRRATSCFRSLPDFIVIGAQRSGTSSLFHCLSQHPQVLPSFKKEIHFFDGGLDPRADNYSKGESWYRAHFPLRKRLIPDRKTGEASPLYLFHPLVADRIRTLVPEVRLVAILRNPIDRTISHYLHTRGLGREPLPLRQALLEEDERLKRAAHGPRHQQDSFIHHSYTSRGRYKEQLERYLTRFPREQLLVVCSEQFFNEPAVALEGVFGFIGVDKAVTIQDVTPRNVATNRIQVDSWSYQYLIEYFAPHNEELFRLLGKRFDW